MFLEVYSLKLAFIFSLFQLKWKINNQMSFRPPTYRVEIEYEN